jgi:hypothetical protein
MARSRHAVFTRTDAAYFLLTQVKNKFLNLMQAVLGMISVQKKEEKNFVGEDPHFEWDSFA